MTLSATPSAPADTLRRGPITVTVMLASTIYALDWTIASVALPHMQGTFSVTQEQISWVITSYILLSAVMLPATSWLAVLGALTFMPRTPPNAAALTFDWKGFFYLGIAIGALQMMLDRGERLDWFESTETVMEACLVLLGAYLFIVT